MYKSLPFQLKFDLMIKRRESAVRDMPRGKETLSWTSDTVTLVHGEQDAILIDAFSSAGQTDELVDWIDSFDRDLKAIFITHVDDGQFEGLRTLFNYFPTAKVIGPSQLLPAIKRGFDAEKAAANWARGFSDRVSPELVPIERERGQTHYLEGHEMRALGVGAAGSDRVALDIPSAGLVVGGEAVLNQTHAYLPADRAGRDGWIAALDRLEGLRPSWVVARHGPLEPDCRPDHLSLTRSYIEDFERVNAQTKTPDELYQRMLELHPTRIDPGALWFSAHGAKKMAC